LIVRDTRVLLDADLARFYGVGTREFNRAITRNPARPPDDFAFKLTMVETRALMFQLGTSKLGRGGTRKPARVFTEQGVAMLASVLDSLRAVDVTVAIVRAFVRLRVMLAGNRELGAKFAELERKLATHDGAIREPLAAIAHSSPSLGPHRDERSVSTPVVHQRN
jgi:hypothetical protein